MKIIIFVCGVILLSVSCKKEGCINENAQNYDEKANTDNGSCKYRDRYTVDDSLFVNGSFNELKKYELDVSYSDASDTIQLSNMWKQSKTISAFKTGSTFVIYEQPFDPTVNVTGSGTLESEKLTIKTSYGSISNRIVGIIN